MLFHKRYKSLKYLRNALRKHSAFPGRTLPQQVPRKYKNSAILIMAYIISKRVM